MLCVCARRIPGELKQFGVYEGCDDEVGKGLVALSIMTIPQRISAGGFVGVVMALCYFRRVYF